MDPDVTEPDLNDPDPTNLDLTGPDPTEPGTTDEMCESEQA